MNFSRSIFITGFPGFIASRLVARLARPDVQFFVLVQPEFVPRAMEEIENISEKTGSPLENFALIEGDITQPDLGIEADDLAAVRAQTIDIFHLAAIYDLAVPMDEAYRVNVEGTKNVNDFALSVANLARYNYVSTCYVAGKRPGRILETDLEHDAGFRNYYEETKYLAETEVEALKTRLPVTVYRPSVVVGDSRTGETAKYDGIYYLISYLQKAPGLLRFVNVGNNEVSLNLVPVDFVVDGIAALSTDPDAVGKTVALADPDPLKTAELFDLIALNLAGKTSVLTPPAAAIERSLLLSVAPTLTGLPHSAVPYFFISQTYDTAVAEGLLAKHGIECPRFGDYAANLIEFVKKHPKL